MRLEQNYTWCSSVFIVVGFGQILSSGKNKWNYSNKEFKYNLATENIFKSKDTINSS